jgi:hypothetical protein
MLVDLEDLPEPRDPYGILQLPDDVGPYVMFMWYILSASETPLERVMELGRRISPGAEEAVIATADWLRAEGEARGVAKGRAEEATSLLTRLLTRRFAIVPAEMREQIEVASVEQLEVWCERVLDAATLDDVFG